MRYELKKISGDASFREFYRLKKNNKTSIIVSAKKQKFKNLAVYVVINNILNRNRINAPNLLSNHYKNNMIEISDLGEKSFYDHVISKKNKFNSYKLLIKLLIKMQKIKVKKLYKFEKLKIKLPNYTLFNLHKESDLFFDWYLKYALKNKKMTNIKKILRSELNKVYKKLNYQNNTFVHRDFHVSNMMYQNKQIALIDNQDALIGNKAYDLASLIDDVRLKTSNSIKEKVFNFYIKTNKKINLEKFKKDFEILSILRNLKIIGIFMRLALRDNKKKYIRLIPYAWEMINHRIKKQKEFKNLMLLLKNNFPKYIR